MATDRELWARIAAGPRFLLLGQGSARTSEYGDSRQPGWFFPTQFAPDPVTRIPELRRAELEAYDSDTADASCPPDLAKIVGVAWNGVLTSRIDGAVNRWFEADWRRVVPSAGHENRWSRSTTELSVRFLFGGLGLPDDEQPPASDLEWIDAQRHASDALSNLATNMITPKGVLLVEGWSLSDWLSPADLYNLASRLAPGQIHLFSAADEVTQSPLIAAAIARDAITAHAATLTEVIAAAAEAGVLVEPSEQATDRSRLIPAGMGFIPIDLGTWNRIVSTARPVDLELLEPFPHAVGPLAYQRFRSFLGTPEGAPPWRAVASGYKLPRTYEPHLLARVENALENADNGPIILQGQTATGKSLALVWLAQALARSGKAAVLHQSRRRDRPTAADIEAYSLWAEDAAGLKTVLIWDGMVDPEDYYTLNRQLRARGQRVLLVGSSYLNPAEREAVITAPIHLDRREAMAVRPWLADYNVILPEATEGADTSFLALLYRALPETESGLRRGLALEMRAAESGMEAMSRDRRQREPETRMTAIAQALKAAGLNIDALTPGEHSSEELAGIHFTERSKTEQMSAMLLCAGRRGLNVPLELALRLVGHEGSAALVEFVKHFDIFRWTEEDSGRQFLGVRTRLEAELLAREDLTDMTEVEVAVSCIRHVRPDLSSRSGGDEVQFVVDLMFQMGPQSEDSGRFARWYGDLANAFREQREQSAFAHPRLVLLEVNLAREHVKRSQRGGELTREERLAQLQNSEELLIRTLEEGDSSSRSRLNLYVELAASIGSQVHEMVSPGDGPEPQSAIEPLIERLVDAVMRARAADPENVYPVDVLAWSTKDAVTSGALSPEAKLSLLADAQASLDSLEPEDLSPGQRAKYRARRAEIASLLGDHELETSYLQELLAMDHPAAYYLLATRAATAGPDNEGLKVALDTLLSAPRSIREDWKCARLLLNLFWQYKTGQRLMRGERVTVAFTESDWRECLELVDSLHGAAMFDRYRLSFIRGLALFQLGSIASSQSEYRSLGALGLDVSRRVHIAFLASNSDGTPQEFTGRVANGSQDGHRGRLWVDQLRAEIDFVPLRFSPEAYRSKNEIMPPFHIGFNYRGPIADPVRRAARRSSGERPA